MRQVPEDRDEDLTWLYDRFAFANDPTGKMFLFVEWLGFKGDEDNPRKRKLDVVEARIT